MKSLFAVISVVLVVLSVGVIATGFGQKPERQATNTMSEKSPPPDREWCSGLRPPVAPLGVTHRRQS